MATLKSRIAGQSRNEKGADPALHKMDGELWLAQRFRDHAHVEVFDGVTDPQVRMQRCREAIKQHGLEVVIVGSKKGKPVNWRQAFESLYGEAL